MERESAQAGEPARRNVEEVGLRRLVVLSAGVSVVSLACGLAASLGTLILARIVRGAFGGGTSQRMFTIAAICGPAFGPVLGGVLLASRQ